VIVLKEKAGTAIQFVGIERGARAETLESGGIGRVDFDRRLEPHGELHYHTSDDWGWVPARARNSAASARSALSGWSGNVGSARHGT
jgi:hypothetical protein